MQIQFSQHLPRMTARVINRSLEERLLSWPWKPFQATRIVYDPFVVRIGNGLHMHPDTFPIVRSFLEKYGIAYKAGDQIYEPAKTQASLWKLR